MTATDRLNRTASMFADAPKDVRLHALLDYSKRLPELPERLADHPELFEVVPECQSPFSLIVEGNDEGVHLFFRVPFEAPTVRGYASILHEALDGAPAQEILEIPDDFYLHMGLQEAVSSQRLNGMAAIVRRLKTRVSALET